MFSPGVCLPALIVIEDRGDAAPHMGGGGIRFMSGRGGVATGLPPEERAVGKAHAR